MIGLIKNWREGISDRIDQKLIRSKLFQNKNILKTKTVCFYSESSKIKILNQLSLSMSVIYGVGNLLWVSAMNSVSDYLRLSLMLKTSVVGRCRRGGYHRRHSERRGNGRRHRRRLAQHRKALFCQSPPSHLLFVPPIGPIQYLRGGNDLLLAIYWTVMVLSVQIPVDTHQHGDGGDEHAQNEHTQQDDDPMIRGGAGKIWENM